MCRVRDITFDPAKDRANRDKHWVSLSLLRAVLVGETVTFPDERHGYGEIRFITFGYVNDRLYVAVWTQRGDTLRAISVRKANTREQKRYGWRPPRRLGRQPRLERVHLSFSDGR